MTDDTQVRRLAHALVPERVKRLLRGRPLIRRLLGNSAWRIGDSVSRMGVGVLVSVYVARYLGPSGFGLISFAAALATLFTAVAQFGMNAVVVRDLVARPQQRAEILGSALLVRLAGGVASILLAVAATAALRPGDREAAVVVLIVATMAVPRAWDVIDYDYQARIQARPVVIARNVSFISFALLRTALVLMHARLEWFAFAITGEATLAAALMARSWRAQGLQVGTRAASWRELRYLVATSWPLVIAGVSMTVYMRIDQVMLDRLMGDAAVGLFAAAVKVSEALYFLPLAVCVTVAPALTAARQRSRVEYERQTLKVMRWLAWSALAVALTFAVLSPAIISTLYGPAYAGAAAVLSIHAWIGVLVSLSYCSNNWLNNEGFLKYSMYQTLVGAVVTVVFNLLLIPRLGVVGAALAGCAGQFTSVILMMAVLPRTRRLFRLQMAALVPLLTPADLAA